MVPDYKQTAMLPGWSLGVLPNLSVKGPEAKWRDFLGISRTFLAGSSQRSALTRVDLRYFYGKCRVDMYRYTEISAIFRRNIPIFYSLVMQDS